MDKNQKIQQFQTLEQNLQNLLLQKQNTQIEFSEIKSALNEIEKTEEDVFKIIGQLMIKTDKSKMKQELIDKEKVLEMRLESFEKQEENLNKKMEELRQDLLGSDGKDIK